MAALIVHRWPALLAFLIAVYLPGAYSFLNEAARAEEERFQRQSESAQAFATAWSDFRGPLIGFGATCGPTAARRSEPCDDLVRHIATSYARMSWYMPTVLADLRVHACHDAPPLKRGLSSTPSVAACQTLVGSGDPTRPSSVAFKDFMNAYARYRDEANLSSQVPTIAALGRAAAVFYWETRKLGCSLAFAKLSAGEEAQRELSTFCSSYLLTHAGDPGWHGDEEWLAWETWFKDAPPISMHAAVLEPPRRP